MRFATGSGASGWCSLHAVPELQLERDRHRAPRSATTSQLNAQVYLGTPVAGCTASVSPTQDPQIVNLGVDAEADFHQYDIEWTPAGVKYFVDGSCSHRTTHADLLNSPRPPATIWASSAASCPLTPTSAPTSADVDWIKVYDWHG